MLYAVYGMVYGTYNYIPFIYDRPIGAGTDKSSIYLFVVAMQAYTLK
jgi:hypothetical protein